MMLFYAYLSAAICMAAAYAILLGGCKMDMTGWISLTVAIIGVLGVFIAALLQLKRDGKSIDRIDSNTAEIKPVVHNIQKSSEKTQDLLQTSIFPSLAAIQQRADRIDFIADGFKEFKRLEAYYSDGIVRQELVLGQISALFTENARLNEKSRRLESENQLLKCENEKLQQKVQAYEKELRQLPQQAASSEWEFEP